MPTRHKFALKAASGLATVLCSLQANAAFAADDPFALPSQSNGQKTRPSLTADNNQAANNNDPFASSTMKQTDEPLFAEVTVNGVPLKRLVKLKRQGDTLTIATDSAIYAGLITQPSAHKYDGQSYIALSSIADIGFKFDPLSYRLDITKRRRSDGPNLIDLARPNSRAENAAKPVTAFMLDYDATTTASRNGVRAAGLVTTRLVRGNVSLDSNWALDSKPDAGIGHSRRLDTTLVYVNPGKMMRMTAGDFITVTPANSRAVRMGGIQISRDFSLRPDLVTYPLPDFTGDVAVPTGLDLLVNDRRLSRNDVEQGEFTVRNIPVPVGRNEIGVVVRDALGRERVQSVSLYTSRALLAPNLSSWSIEAGSIRRNFGREHDHYGAFAASGFYRRGLSNSLTGEFAGEWRNGFVNLGGGASIAVGSLGLISADVRASRHNLPEGDRRGHLFGLSFESVGPRFSLRLNGRKASEGYDDLASASGDAPPSSIYSAELGFDLKKLGSFRLAAVEQHRQRWRHTEGMSRRDRLLSMSYRNSIKNGLNFYFDLTHRKSDDAYNITTALFGLSMQFGARAFGQMSVSVQGNRDQTEFSYYKPDIVPGDIGYNIQAGAGVMERLGGMLSSRQQWGRIEAQSEILEGNVAGRVSARGSLIFADGNLHASERSSGGVLIVDSKDIDGVEVTRENRAVGKTGKDGTLLLTGFTPYVPAKIAIDPDKLSNDILARKLDAMVKLPPRSVARLTLDVSRYVPVRFTLSDQQNRFFEPGTTIRALPSNSDYTVGFDGLVEINAALKDNTLQITLIDGSVCHADLHTIIREKGNLIGQLHCAPTLKTKAIIAQSQPQTIEQSSLPSPSATTSAHTVTVP